MGISLKKNLRMQRFLLPFVISFLALSGMASQKEITLLTLQALQEKVSLNKGKIILLDFWTSW